jgi:hypothetical protein
MEMLITRSGLTVVDHPAAGDLRERYFRNRTDGLTPWSGERLITGQVSAE